MIWYTIILLALGTAICADQTDDIDISDVSIFGDFHYNLPYADLQIHKPFSLALCTKQPLIQLN